MPNGIVSEARQLFSGTEPPGGWAADPELAADAVWWCRQQAVIPNREPVRRPHVWIRTVLANWRSQPEDLEEVRGQRLEATRRAAAHRERVHEDLARQERLSDAQRQAFEELAALSPDEREAFAAGSGWSGPMLSMARSWHALGRDELVAAWIRARAAGSPPGPSPGRGKPRRSRAREGPSGRRSEAIGSPRGGEVPRAGTGVLSALKQQVRNGGRGPRRRIG